MGRGKRRQTVGVSLAESPRSKPETAESPEAIISLGESPRLSKIVPASLTKSLLKEAPPRLEPKKKPEPKPSQPAAGGQGLRGRVVVPTGGITGIVRNDVIPMLQSAGAQAYDDAKYITASTLVLVSGIQADKWQRQDPKMSSKLKKAKQVGAQVEVVRDATDFRNILSGARPV
jgi:NAD-dependent DNA ligase